MEPRILKLTGSEELDDRIYRDFKQSFPIFGLDLHKFQSKTLLLLLSFGPVLALALPGPRQG